MVVPSDSNVIAGARTSYSLELPFHLAMHWANCDLLRPLRTGHMLLFPSVTQNPPCVSSLSPNLLSTIDGVHEASLASRPQFASATVQTRDVGSEPMELESTNRSH